MEHVPKTGRRTADRQAVAVPDGSGRPLEPDVRAFMESRFGEDFSRVRVHADRPAAEAVAAVDAKAFTFGEDVVFRPGEYSPRTGEGRRSLAHELAHVVQQRRGGGPAPGFDTGHALESSADAAAAAVSGAGPVRVSGASAPGLARQVETKPVSPLVLPKEGISMPWVGKGEGIDSSDLGFLRDSERYWADWVKKWGKNGALSQANLAAIAGGRSPVVDAQWVQVYPQHKAYLGQVLEHHHVGQGAFAVPLPHDLHKAHSVFHPKRQTVGQGNRPLKPVNPLQPRSTTEGNVAKHTGSGRIRGEGITPKNPPKVGRIPPSSGLSAGVKGVRPPGAKGMGKSLLGVVIVLGMSALASKAQAATEDSARTPALNRIDAEIEASLLAQFDTYLVLQLDNPGASVYANITLSTTTATTRIVAGTEVEEMTRTSPPELVSVVIAATPVSATETVLGPENRNAFYEEDTDVTTYPAELTLVSVERLRAEAAARGLLTPERDQRLGRYEATLLQRARAREREKAEDDEKRRRAKLAELRATPPVTPSPELLPGPGTPARPPAQSYGPFLSPQRAEWRAGDYADAFEALQADIVAKAKAVAAKSSANTLSREELTAFRAERDRWISDLRTVIKRLEGRGDEQGLNRLKRINDWLANEGHNIVMIL
ncbi:eCIS core domain-containing protein [Amycolatopsis suaedae]|nr:DUF4157 domain-containing protein [Amycolatopsis suaedae]